MKTCTKCLTEKSLDKFSKDRSKKDGFQTHCKSCKNMIRKEWRHGIGKEKQLAHSRSYRSIPEIKEKISLRIRAYSKANRKIRNAQQQAYRAVQKGLINKTECIVCGGESEAHHPDYDRPLDVVWLCHHHHKEAHTIGDIYETLQQV